MCGIFATTRPDVWNPLLGRVLGILRHRGPDASGSWLSPDGSVLLAHTRLEVIGLGAAGAQPAHSADGSLAVTYNGEIYNYRQQGGLMGLTAVTSDTQVLCELLRRNGASGLGDLRGMFAFVAWDEERQTLAAA